MQITGFLLPGEVVGLDSLSDERHNSHAIALEDSEVCVIRLDEMDELAPRLPVLQTQLRRLMRSEEHTSELQSLVRISHAVFSLKKTLMKNVTQQPQNCSCHMFR